MAGAGTLCLIGLTACGGQVGPGVDADADADADAQHAVMLQHLKTFDVPGTTAEIVQYAPDQRLLFSVNPYWHTLDVFEVDALDPPAMRPLPDTTPERPGIQGWPLGGEPTSCALHPTEPIVFVTVLGDAITERGRLLGYDLRAESRGEKVLDMPVGIHPDSVAVSPDGRLAVVANEAEGHPETPGSISVIELEALTAEALVSEEDTPGDGLPIHTVEGLAEAFGDPIGGIEPEFVAIDARSGFAVVTCQENDGAVVVDLHGSPSRVMRTIHMRSGDEPDGVAVLNDVPGPAGKRGVLVGLPAEGRYDVYEDRWLGQALVLAWVDPDNLAAEPMMRARIEISRRINPDKPDKRRDPESVAFTRLGGRARCLLAVERGDRLMCFDVTDPDQPVQVGMVRVGDRPEGLIVVPHGADRIVITGDEGNEGPGEISFSRLRVVE